MTVVSPFFQKTALIRYSLGDERYIATGTLYRYNNSTYLITNRHVFRHEHEISPENLRLSLRKSSDPTEVEPYEVKTMTGDRSLWKIHPDYPGADLAVIELDIDIDNYGNTPFVPNDIQKRDTHLELAGASINSVGYPGVIGNRNTTKPIIRSGLVASSYGDFFGDEPCFVMEANMQDGMSGSPVVLKPNVQYPDSEGRLSRPAADQDPTTEAGRFYSDRDGESQTLQTDTGQLGFPTRLVGIHSGPVEKQNQLNLHRVWYPNLINEIIEQGDHESFGG